MHIISSKPRSLISANGHTGKRGAIGNAIDIVKIGKK